MAHCWRMERDYFGFGMLRVQPFAASRWEITEPLVLCLEALLSHACPGRASLVSLQGLPTSPIEVGD
jgi:hypothetical protein